MATKRTTTTKTTRARSAPRKPAVQLDLPDLPMDDKGPLEPRLVRPKLYPNIGGLVIKISLEWGMSPQALVNHAVLEYIKRHDLG